MVTAGSLIVHSAKTARFGTGLTPFGKVRWAFHLVSAIIWREAFCLFIVEESKMNKINQPIRRRTFVGAVFAGLGITGLSARPPKPKAGGIPMREFGKTGVKLTVIGQGGARLALLRNKEAARAQVRHAYDLGLNYFDCAHAYWDGHSEEVYGDVLADVRKHVFITTKCTQRTRQEAEHDLNTSLKSLKTDYVDLWQMHGIQDQADVDRIFAPGGAIEAFEAARKAGKCRFFGFTGHHDPNTHVAMLRAYDKWDSILMPLHAADPAYSELPEDHLAAGGGARHRHPSHEGVRQRVPLARFERRGMPEVRFEPAHSLRRRGL